MINRSPQRQLWRRLLCGNGSRRPISRNMGQHSMHNNTRIRRVQAASEINSCKFFHGDMMNKRSIAELNCMFGIFFPLCNDVASMSHFWDPIKGKHQTGNQGKNSDAITENSICGFYGYYILLRFMP